MAHGWCLASNQKLHAQRQHRVAHGASHRIKCCMQRSIAWQWYLASNQWMHARRQHCVAHGALHRVECCMPCSVAWDMPRFKVNSCTPRTAAASRGTGMVPRFKAMAARTAAASCGTWIVPRLKSIAARHARRQHRVAQGSCLASNRLHIQQQHRVAHGSCLAQINGCMHTTHGGSIAWHMNGASLEPMAARHTRRQHARRQHRVAHGRCLAPNQCLHTRRQQCVAHGGAPLQLNGCTPCTAAASRGTWMVPRVKISCCTHCIALTSCCIMGSSDPGGVRQIPARSDLRQAIGPFQLLSLPPDARLGLSSPTGGRMGSHPHLTH